MSQQAPTDGSQADLSELILPSPNVNQNQFNVGFLQLPPAEDEILVDGLTELVGESFGQQLLPEPEENDPLSQPQDDVFLEQPQLEAGNKLYGLIEELEQPMVIDDLAEPELPVGVNVENPMPLVMFNLTDAGDLYRAVTGPPGMVRVPNSNLQDRITDQLIRIPMNSEEGSMYNYLLRFHDKALVHIARLNNGGRRFSSLSDWANKIREIEEQQVVLRRD